MGTLSRIARSLIPLLAAAALLGGCIENPFTPASPEAPTGGGPITNFTTPEKLLTTIEEAISAENEGAVAYGEVIADSTTNTTPFGFYAVPDPGVLAAWRATPGAGDPYDPGDVRHERLFFSELVQVLESFDYVFVFGPDNSGTSLDDIGPETALLHRYYVLQATSADGRITKEIAIGYADLTLRKHNGRWWLARWDDRVDPLIGVNPANTDNRTMGARRLDL